MKKVILSIAIILTATAAGFSQNAQTVMKQFIFLGLIFFFVSCGEKKEPSKLLIDNFFEIYKTKGSNEALNDIFQTNKYLIKHSQSDIEHLKESLGSLVSVLGNYNGYEILSQYSIGKSIIHYCCIVKYDTQPIRFNFIFYKSSNTWILYNFNYDNNLVDEIG